MKLRKTKTRAKPPVEFRPHSHGRWLDELIATDVSHIHVEQMAVDSFWVGIEFRDHPNMRVACWFEVGRVVKDDEGNDTRELKLRAEVERTQ